MSLPASLTTLETSGLIRLAQTEPDLEFLFRRGLIQDAALVHKRLRSLDTSAHDA